MRILCAIKNCKYSSGDQDSSHIIFIKFPNDDTSKMWAHHCGRTDLLMKSNEELHLNYCICSHHIEDRYYISKTDPIIIEQGAVPTLFRTDISMEKGTRNVLDRNEHAQVTDNVELAYCDMDAEIDQYHDIGIRFSNLCRICGESTMDGIEIFAAKGIELKLKDKIESHMPITVDVEDLMPQKLCTNCYGKLEIVHSLVVTSLKTDMRFRRFLNVTGEADYDIRYNSLVEECSLEIAQEMCINEASEAASLELPSGKDEGIATSREAVAKMTELETTDVSKNNFENTGSTEIHSELNTFIESYDHRVGEKNDDIRKIVTNIPEDGINRTNEIPCLLCKDTFKTREIFENHKMLCDVDDVMIARKGTDVNTDIGNAESKESERNFDGENIYTEQSKETGKNLNVERDLESNGNINPVELKKRCGHCDVVYSTKKELLTHLTEYHGGQLLFKCFTCNKSYEKWSSLDVHEATHRVDKPYLCDLCGKCFKHSNNLRGHKRIHLDDSKKKRHICEICGNAFRSRFHLREHMNQHIGIKPYPCEKCGKAFFKRIQLRQHKLSHDLNRHVCPICGASFNRRGNMNAHLKRHNNGDGTYTCSVCASKCKSMSELKLHRKKHTEQDIIESIRKKCIDKTIWQCKICNRVFSKQVILKNHERVHRGEKESVECHMCGKKLASKSSLVYHNKSMHSTERPHMCQYCGESFVSQNARLVHERIHTGERPYACKICKMRYKCSSNLNQHMKIHTGVRPHKCGYCSKSFARKGALNVHERIHTGVKPFPCETCGRTFSQKNDMLKHTKTHEVKSMRCEQCSQVFTRKKDILKHVASHEQDNSIIQEYIQVQQQLQPYTISVTCSQIE